MEYEQVEEQLRNNYSLKAVTSTGKKIGFGAYGNVEEVMVNGAICAAKKVHRVLLHHSNDGVETFKRKFFGECVIMSKLRHPHVVQFLGVYFPSEDQRRMEASMNSTPPIPEQGLLLPWLIMELLPVNLSNFLDSNREPFLPYSVKASLLLDISKGLTYLHSQTPPIIHRDLTAKNILINSALMAKIADFGVARITDPACSTMSVGPGTIAYMPPEVHSSGTGGVNNHAHYFTSVDIFSFGVIVLYTIIQDCPLNLRPATYPDDETGFLIAVSEVERRDKYFVMAESRLTDTTAPEYTLIGLSKRCLDNAAGNRPAILEVLLELKELKDSLPDELLEKDKLSLMRLAAEGQEKTSGVSVVGVV
jgi:serine/threonine protein kinase